MDSGAGGISTLKVLRKILPYEDYIYFADNKNMPYGNKSRAFLAENAIAIIKRFRRIMRSKWRCLPATL